MINIMSKDDSVIAILCSFLLLNRSQKCRIRTPILMEVMRKAFNISLSNKDVTTVEYWEEEMT